MIHAWPFCTLSQRSPPVIWTRICGHSLNFHSRGLSDFSSFGSQMTLDCSLQSCLYSKGEYKVFVFMVFFFGGFVFLRTNLWNPSCLNSPVFEVSLSPEVVFRPGGLGKHIFMFGFWDPLLSFIPTSYTSMLPAQLNQLPGSAVLQKRMEMRTNSGAPVCHAEFWKSPPDSRASHACLSVRTSEMLFHWWRQGTNGLMSRLW